MYPIAQQFCIPYFSTSESSGGAPGTLSIWRTGPTIRVNNRNAEGPLIKVKGVRGNVAPAINNDLNITDAAGRRSEGHLTVTTIDRLQMDDEASGVTSWRILWKGRYHFLEEEDDWDYAQGNVYRATRDRRRDNV